MSEQIVYIHYGSIPDYLVSAMEVCRCFNPNVAITLIHNTLQMEEKLLERLGALTIDLHYVDFFTTNLYQEFKNIYIHRLDWDKTNILYNYELFNMFRFVQLLSYCKSQQLDTVMYCDSDLVICHDVRDTFFKEIKSHDMVLLWPHSTFCSCWTVDALEKFNQYITEIYNNRTDLDIVVPKFSELARGEFNFSDMWLLKSYLCAYPNVSEESEYTTPNDFITLPKVQSSIQHVKYLGNIYSDWAKGKCSKNNKFADTLRTLISTYKDTYHLDWSDHQINSLTCFGQEPLTEIQTELTTMQNLIKLDKPNIVHFQGQCKRYLHLFVETFRQIHLDNHGHRPPECLSRLL